MEKQEIEEYEQIGWEISRVNIDWYRNNDDHIVLQGVSILNESENGEISDLVEKYIRGKIDADALLAGIDGEMEVTREEET